MSADIDNGMIIQCVRAPEGSDLTIDAIYQCEAVCDCLHVVLREVLGTSCPWCNNFGSIRVKGKGKFCYCPCMFKPFNGDGVVLMDEEEVDKKDDREVMVPGRVLEYV